MRRRVLMRVRSVVLAALLLVPLVASGHHHAADAPSAGPCALCLATHHAPAAVGAPPVAPTPLMRQFAAVSKPIAAPVHRVPSPIAGRAPPVSSPITIS